MRSSGFCGFHWVYSSMKAAVFWLDPFLFWMLYFICSEVQCRPCFLCLSVSTYENICVDLKLLCVICELKTSEGQEKECKRMCRKNLTSKSWGETGSWRRVAAVWYLLGLHSEKKDRMSILWMQGVTRDLVSWGGHTGLWHCLRL